LHTGTNWAVDHGANTVGDAHRHGFRIGRVARLAKPPLKFHVVLLFEPFGFRLAGRGQGF